MKQGDDTGEDIKKSKGKDEDESQEHESDHEKILEKDSQDESNDDEKVKIIQDVNDMDMETLKSSLTEKEKLADEYYDRLLRSQAELENYKKRTEKELADFRVYANAQLIKELLGIIDDFQCALAVEEDDSNNKFMEGMELIYKNFYGLLEKEGLSIIDPLNEKFDPYKHEAVEMVPTEDHPEHTILGVIQPGYQFKDKILRPAMVRVATVPKMANEEKEVEEESKNCKINDNEKDD